MGGMVAVIFRALILGLATTQDFVGQRSRYRRGVSKKAVFMKTCHELRYLQPQCLFQRPVRGRQADWDQGFWKLIG